MICEEYTTLFFETNSEASSPLKIDLGLEIASNLAIENSDGTICLWKGEGKLGQLRPSTWRSIKNPQCQLQDVYDFDGQSVFKGIRDTQCMVYIYLHLFVLEINQM